MNRTTMLVLLLGIITLVQAQANGFCNLVWSDEFNGPTVSSDWTKESTCNGGGNNEMQCYTTRDKNVFTNNGDLVLRAYREDFTGSNAGCTDSQGCTNHKTYTSGRVNTFASRAWLYGRFETRAKLPSGYQLWPAIWMLPTDSKYGGWAASGEIDIMESRGNNPSLASGTLHHGGSWPSNIYTTSGDHSIGVDLSQDFHVYSLEWTQDTMTWYIDNTVTQQFNMNRWWNSSVNNNPYSAKGQPFDQRFSFILNLAVGGGFFGGDAPVSDAQSAAWLQPELRVDYVRVYQQGGNCNQAPQPTQAADGNARPTTTQASTSGTCNGQTFDSRSFTCTINGAGQQVLCAVNTLSCANACYNPSQYCCNNGHLAPVGTCPAAPTPTTTTTPTTTATTAAPVTPVTPGQCRGQGYDSNTYTCTINELGQQILCSVGMASCSSACFNPSLYCCQSGGLRQKGQCSAVVTPTSNAAPRTTTTVAPTVAPTSSAVTSCNGQSFDTVVYSCTTNERGQNVLCPKTQSSCGGACYNPNSYCCKTGALISKSQC